MKAIDWIERVKKHHNVESDYAVAKALGVGRGTVSNYRTRSRATLDEDMSIKVATALGERPEAVLLDQYAERTKNPAARSALLSAASRLCILC